LRCEDGMLAALPLLFCPKRPVRKRLYTGRAMGEWYWIGLCTGLGVSGGLLGAALLGWTRVGVAAAVAFGAAAGVAIGFGLENWDEALGGGLGGLAGGFGAATIVRGALRRGGTRGGTATLVAAAALAVAAVALVPALGYVEALAAPILALRLRGRGGGRYAGLRILARD
jgi:hypothetical protein